MPAANGVWELQDTLSPPALPHSPSHPIPTLGIGQSCPPCLLPALELCSRSCLVISDQHTLHAASSSLAFLLLVSSPPCTGCMWQLLLSPCHILPRIAAVHPNAQTSKHTAGAPAAPAASQELTKEAMLPLSQEQHCCDAQPTGSAHHSLGSSREEVRDAMTAVALMLFKTAKKCFSRENIM